MSEMAFAARTIHQTIYASTEFVGYGMFMYKYAMVDKFQNYIKLP